MKLIFFIIIISQLLNLLSVFADNFKRKSSDFNSIKWEKLERNKTNNLEKIIWKPIKGYEIYFQENSEKDSTLNYSNNLIEENKYKSKRRSSNSITEIEPFLPLNNFLDNGKIQTSLRWKSSFEGGVSKGIGQQNPSIIFDYGISESSLLSIYFSETDDNLYNLIDGNPSNYHWQNYAFSFKKKLLGGNEYIFGLSMVSTVEYWRHSSGSEYTKSIYNQTDSSFSKDQFENIVGALSFPVSKKFNDNLQLIIVPGVTFLPNKLGSKGIGRNAYGNNFYLGSGLILGISEDIDILLSYTTPLGPGNNYFDNELNYSRKPIFSLGLGWKVNPRIGIEGKITNSYGSSPSTGLLTIPSDNKPLYSANIIYKPFEEDTFLKPLNTRDKLISHGGLISSNSLIPKVGTSQINFNYDSKGNWFGFYGYSLSNIFQLELLNIGSFRDINLLSEKNVNLSNTFLNENNLNFRLGGKILILSPQKDDQLWLAFRTSLGRNNDTNQGFLFSEFINTFRLNDWFALNVNPKYFFSGVESFGGLGLSSYISLDDNLMFIPEINKSFNNGSDYNSSFALRYSYNQNTSVDLYFSNSAGIQDIGQMIQEKNFRYGIKLNFLY